MKIRKQDNNSTSGMPLPQQSLFRDDLQEAELRPIYAHNKLGETVIMGYEALDTEDMTPFHKDALACQTMIEGGKVVNVQESLRLKTTGTSSAPSIASYPEQSTSGTVHTMSNK